MDQAASSIVTVQIRPGAGKGKVKLGTLTRYGYNLLIQKEFHIPVLLLVKYPG